ncbi:MAG TPA: hypothetical protein VIP82_02875 [Microbacterium sp.]|uniref:hypothetical protein n=1 Tax=Microbacterium sp. TaxID=51671 RepID=UPI002F944B0D
MGATSSRDADSTRPRRRDRPQFVIEVSMLVLTIIGIVFSAWAFFGKTPAQLADSADSYTPAPVVTAEPAPSPEPSAPPVHVGWGPERDTFTVSTPAPYAILNSITDHPDVGDERNFVRIRQKGEGNYTDFIRVAPGDRLQLSVYVGNDAADNLDGSAATIHGLQADFDIFDPGQDIGISVVLSGKNAAEVWDGATVLADESVELHPVAGTMTMLTNSGRWSIDMGSELHKVTLGWDRPDGEFPVGYASDGKYRGMGYVTVELQVEAAR